MTQRVGRSLLAREALLAAMEAKKREVSQSGTPGGQAFTKALGGVGASQQPSDVPAPGGVSSVVESLKSGLDEVNQSVQRADALDEALVSGKVQDFHEVAVHLKQADLSFRFALEVRNRLIDAYREVMRMNV